MNEEQNTVARRTRVFVADFGPRVADLFDGWCRLKNWCEESGTPLFLAEERGITKAIRFMIIAPLRAEGLTEILQTPYVQEVKEWRDYKWERIV